MSWLNWMPNVLLRRQPRSPHSRYFLPLQRHRLTCLGLLGLLASRQPDLSAMWTAQGFRLLGVSDSDVLAAVDRLLTMEIHLDESALRPAQDDDKFPPLQLRFGEGQLPILLNNWLRPDFKDKLAPSVSCVGSGPPRCNSGPSSAAPRKSCNSARP